MAKIVTLGEIMLRLSPEGNDRFIQSESFRIIPGGGEANVAVSVANYGHEAYFVSKLPKHEIGQIAVNALRRYGVNTDFIARGGDRVGLYYAETGASMRPSKVIYDRAHSSIAEADPSDFDFDAIMEGAQWFHWSGKTSCAVSKLDDEGLLYINLLTEPTFGGITASFGMLGDIIVAEQGARIGFAGRRVIEQTIRQKLPSDFQTAEYLLKYGQVDVVSARKDLRDTLAKILEAHKGVK